MRDEAKAVVVGLVRGHPKVMKQPEASALLIAIGSAGVGVALARYDPLQSATIALPLWFGTTPALAAALTRLRPSAGQYFLNGVIASLSLALALGVAVDDSEHTRPVAFIEWFTVGLIPSSLGLLACYVAAVMLKRANPYRWRRGH